MRKFVLMALAGTAIALAAPEFASATPVSLGTNLSAIADGIASTGEVRHRRWHRRHHHRHWHRRWNSRRW